MSIEREPARRPGMNANIAIQTTEPAGLAPAIAVRDVARATAFYQRAFAAAVVTRTVGPDGNLVGAQLSINGAPLELTEGTAIGTGGTVSLKVDDVERWWRRAVTAGCAIAMPLGIGTGGLQGTVRDPFGLVWSLGGARARRRPCLLSNLG
jgi:PhnB protein